MSAEPDSLIGVRDCGCITAYCSIEHSTKREQRQFYGEMAQSNREVRRVRLDDVRDQPGFMGCVHVAAVTEVEPSRA